MTVLTQLSVGAFATIFLLQLLGVSSLGAAAVGSMLVGGLALSASTLHLGRPAYAYRALRMWKRSWLSREVLLFSSFSAVAGLYAAALWMAWPGAAVLGGVTTLLGIAGVTASGCIYRVPSRPAWNSPFTILQFNLTAAVLGPLFAGALGVGDTRWLAIAAASMAGALFLLLAARFFRLIASDRIELRGTARLLSTVLRSRLIGRGVLLAVGGLVLPLLAISAGPQDAPYVLTGVGPASIFAAALTVTLAAEILGRYLFFVSVVPAHMAAPYLPLTAEAA
jgi:DMSO reductase anchor subunit